MKIKKVDDKPMVIHTKEKAKIHAHEPKGAKIKGSNIYTVERGPKVHDAKANEMDKKASAKLMLQKSAGGKRTYRKSTIHQSEAKDKGLSRFKRNIRESGTSIKTKNTNLHIAGRTGALAAGAVTEQVEGGQEVSQAAYLAYESSRPVTGTASKGAALFRKKAAAEAKKRIKKVEAGKKLAKKTAKKAAKDTAKTVAKETAKETAKTTAKVATKTATKAAATAAGTAVAPGVGTAIGMAAGYAAGVSIEVKDEKMTNRSRKIKFFLDKMRAQENQTDSVAKLVKDLIVRKAITWVKAAAPIIGLVLLLLVLVVAMIAVPVIAVIAILYNSPFALFLPPLESGDTVQTVTSAYVQEFNRDVNTKVNEHTGYDLGELVYVDYEGMEENPSNYYDIMAVYMVKHGIGDTATVMNDISKAENFAEYYRAANVTLSARFCLDDIQLGHFLQGFYNDSKEFRFDKEASSSECVAKLKEIGMTDKGWVDDFNLHYEMENRSFERGQTFHNFNDHDYMVLEALSPRNLVVMDMKSGSLTIALGATEYKRYPKDEKPTKDNTTIGVSWEHGIYLGSTLSTTNFKAYKREYGTPEKIEDIYDYRAKLKQKFYFYQDMSKDDDVPKKLQNDFLHQMYEDFGTIEEDCFYDRLEDGKYDEGFKERQVKEEKCR